MLAARRKQNNLTEESPPLSVVSKVYIPPITVLSPHLVLGVGLLLPVQRPQVSLSLVQPLRLDRVSQSEIQDNFHLWRE